MAHNTNTDLVKYTNEKLHSFQLEYSYKDIWHIDEHTLDGHFEPLQNESQFSSSRFDIEKPNNALLQMDKKIKKNFNIIYNLKTKNANVEMNINNVLHNHDLFRLHNFAYSIGDFLFDTFQVLLHLKYTSVESREGTIEYFKPCLRKQDWEAIASYENELNTCSLMEMHGANDREVYLHRMSK